MSTYAKVLEISEGKASNYVPFFQKQATFVDTTTFTEVTVESTLDSALTYISFVKNGQLTYGIVENTSLNSILETAKVK